MLGVPMAANCSATCRPIAPTPITSAWQFAKRSGGTRSRCRTSRSGYGQSMVGFMLDFLLDRDVGERIQLGTPRVVLPPGNFVVVLCEGRARRDGQGFRQAEDMG